MKRLILTTLALAVGATFAYSQGTVTINNTTTTYYIRTNTGTFYDGGATGSVTNRGAAGTGTSTYRYAVLFQNYDPQAPIADPLNPLAGWEAAGVTGVNGALKGSISSGASVAVTGWPAPTSGQYSSGTLKYYMIVGWSSNIGTDWTAALAWMTDPARVQLEGVNYFFGHSAVGFNVAGGGPNALAAVPLFFPSTFTGIAGSGLGTGFDLYLVPVIPEPTSFALAGLGAAALLIFRRRK